MSNEDAKRVFYGLHGAFRFDAHLINETGTAPSIILLGVFSRPERPTESLSTKQAQFHRVPIKTQRGPKKRGI